MHAQQRILLKLTGQIFLNKTTGLTDSSLANSIVDQIKKLSSTHQFGIVIGGGNLFRGSQQGKQLGLSPWAAHTSGMLATLINGVMLSDILIRAGIKTTLVSALHCPQVAEPISQQRVNEALKNGQCIIFAGGTGNPYFTTDTNAILRALEIGSLEVWKGTSVPGVYESDPLKVPTAKMLKKVSYKQALDNHLGIMDTTAFTLAHDNGLTIRVFNIFEQDALVQAAQDSNFGTIIQR